LWAVAGLKFASAVAGVASANRAKGDA